MNTLALLAMTDMGAKAREVRRLNRPIGYVVDKMRRIAGAKLKFQL